MADRAIKDVKQERAAIEARFKHEERMCYQNEFFANRCRNQAKERRRLALAETRSVQIEANQYKRHAAVDKRDEAMAKKNAGEPADQRKRAAEAQAHDKRMADQQKRSQKKQLAAESKQGKNEEVYAKKVKQAEERRRQVVAKKAEKEEKRRKKAAAQAEKNKPSAPETVTDVPTKR